MQFAIFSLMLFLLLFAIPFNYCKYLWESMPVRLITTNKHFAQTNLSSEFFLQIFYTVAKQSSLHFFFATDRLCKLLLKASFMDTSSSGHKANIGHICHIGHKAKFDYHISPMATNRTKKFLPARNKTKFIKDDTSLPNPNVHERWLFWDRSCH